MTIQIDELMKGLEKEGKVVSSSPRARMAPKEQPAEVTLAALYDASLFGRFWRALGITIYALCLFTWELVQRFIRWRRR